MIIAFAVPGEPKGKARPRTVQIAGHASTYTPKETVMYENLVRLYYQQAARGLRLSGPIQAEIVSYLSVPKSTSKKKRALMLDIKTLCQKKPDVDNLAKIVLDSLNKIAYDDDAQVCRLLVEKRYGGDPSSACQIERAGTMKIYTTS